MRILSWNCQGAGYTPTVRHLREIRGQYFPEVTFLWETKNKRNYMEKVMAHLGYFDLSTVEPIGKSGGLALMWKETIQMKILYIDRRMTDTQITCKTRYSSLLVSLVTP